MELLVKIGYWSVGFAVAMIVTIMGGMIAVVSVAILQMLLIPMLYAASFIIGAVIGWFVINYLRSIWELRQERKVELLQD